VVIILAIILAIPLYLRQEHRSPGPDRAEGPRAAAAPFASQVSKTIDGDSLRLEDGTEVRLLGIDAPEVGQPFHDEAREACRRLTRGTVRIEPAQGRSRDAYGRLRARVFQGKTLVNEELVLEGFALVYIKEEREMAGADAQRLVNAQNLAMDRRQGIWSGRQALDPPAGQPLVATKLRFHRSHCPSLGQGAASARPTTREAALRAGKSPCRTCKPRRRHKAFSLYPPAARRRRGGQRKSLPLEGAGGASASASSALAFSPPAHQDLR
jgi:micrococcal nuclease